MRIFDANNVEIETPNLKKGYLKNDSLFIMHHEAMEAVEEEGHWETIAEYPNGGKDVEWVVDVPAVEAKDAYDEYEDIFRYIEYTQEELVAILNPPLSIDEKLALLAEAIDEEPYPEEPPKTGYKYQRMYSNGRGAIVWTLVPDLDNPIEFIEGMSVTEDLYYTDGADIYLCTQSGDAESLQDTAYFTKQ